MKKNYIITISLIVFITCLGTVVFLYRNIDRDVIVIEQKKNDNLVKNVFEVGEVKYIEKQKNNKPVTILFGGDAMFDRYIRQMAESSSYESILQGVKNIMIASDCTMLNLEGPITESVSISKHSVIGSPKNFIFTFDPQIISVLADHNVCLVNIGNNHINNFGTEGIVNTKKFLKNSTISYLGDTGMENEQRYIIKDIGDVRFAFVNYNAFVRNARENTLSDIKSVKGKSDFIVLYTHWGTEYKTVSNIRERELAHLFVDAGVDLIIGSHPHVVQEREVYKDKIIYYSLGNFVFDQYFSSETKKGLIVRATFDLNEKEIITEEKEIVLHPNGKTEMKQ
ncbi:MAG: hypothetical protein CR972_01110 [Candidatus Moraniibacteriota bacterium]|nr:MAG: hypothetical protein CR972_01110 [Candidatus Moranbacteria bacterium]